MKWRCDARQGTGPGRVGTCRHAVGLRKSSSRNSCAVSRVSRLAGRATGIASASVLVTPLNNLAGARAGHLENEHAFDVQRKTSVHRAEQGAQATATMAAKHGRAGWMGSKSAGVPDAGATAIALMFESLAGHLNSTEKPGPYAS